MFRRYLLALAAAVALLAFAHPAYACPMCKDTAESNPQLAAMYNWSVILLVSLPFVLVAVIGVRAGRALDPTAYQELKQRLRGFLWPRGWLYLSSGVVALALLFYVTTPPDPLTRLRLPYAALEAQPTVSAASLLPRLEGRVVVVTFFASWCPPCLEQLADLARLQHEFGDERLAMVAVNAFEDEATPPGVPHLHADGTLHFHEGAPDLPSFLEVNHVALPVMASTPALSAAFGDVTRIPTIFVFDAEGRLVQRYVNEPRGDFVRPTLDALRGDVRGAAACGQFALALVREACIFLRDKDGRLGTEAGPW